MRQLLEKEREKNRDLEARLMMVKPEDDVSLGTLPHSYLHEDLVVSYDSLMEKLSESTMDETARSFIRGLADRSITEVFPMAQQQLHAIAEIKRELKVTCVKAEVEIAAVKGLQLEMETLVDYLNEECQYMREQIKAEKFETAQNCLSTVRGRTGELAGKVKKVKKIINKVQERISELADKHEDQAAAFQAKAKSGQEAERERWKQWHACMYSPMTILAAANPVGLFALSVLIAVPVITQVTPKLIKVRADTAEQRTKVINKIEEEYSDTKEAFAAGQRIFKDVEHRLSGIEATAKNVQAKAKMVKCLATNAARREEDIAALGEAATQDYRQRLASAGTSLLDNVANLEKESETLRSQMPGITVLNRLCDAPPRALAAPRPDGRRILVIDGGGAKGIIPAMLLAQIEREMNKPAHEIFDLICGTSTGGLMSILVGISKWPAEDVVKLYAEEGSRLFPKGVLSGGYMQMGLSGSKYSADGFEKLVGEKVGDLRMDGEPEPSPKVFVVSCRGGKDNNTFLFRNYIHSGGQAGTHRCSVLEAARATSAAPSYLPPVKLSIVGKEHLFKDGGLVANNPTSLAIQEALALWPGQPISCVLSLGCGKAPDPVEFGTGALHFLFKELPEVALSTEPIHDKVTQAVVQGSIAGQQNLVYYRLNPILEDDDKKPLKVDLDTTDPKLIEAMQKVATSFIRKVGVEANFKNKTTTSSALGGGVGCELYASLRAGGESL